MAKKAVEGIQQLIDRTGGPRIKATVTVDQVYAQDQHENMTYVHTSGGGSKYLESPLMELHPMWIEDFAQRFLNARRSTARLWGDVVAQPLVRQVAVRAPVTTTDLRNSAALTVKEGSSVVMDVPARVRRLSREELIAIDKTRTEADRKRGGA